MMKAPTKIFFRMTKFNDDFDSTLLLRVMVLKKKVLLAISIIAKFCYIVNLSHRLLKVPLISSKYHIPEVLLHP